MGEQSPKPANTPTGAVFLSYASQDAQAAQRICEALRAAGVEVWFDQSELRGGDAWDQSIRKQIKTCALFVPVISQHTHERAEGYFRLEWNLAVDRCQRISADRAFLVPVVIDETPDDDERVPERFRDLQWTRLLDGETPTEFVRRIQQLLSGETPPLSKPASRPRVALTARPSRLKPAGAAFAIALVAVTAYLIVEKPWTTKPLPPIAFSPPAHSIAVLPFINMSGDKEQEYFSDGLTEEILNSLARINELQVVGRTSSFYFKGKDVDLGTVAHKLNVSSVLEGSVRRSERTVRVTAQLINAATGFHLWSQTYDRNLGDVLKLQAEIANAVASALKVTLLGDIAAKIELGGTRNPAAFDAYLRASTTHAMGYGAKDEQAAIVSYDEAVSLDPKYALAFADRSLALASLAAHVTGRARHDALGQGQADADKAIELAPDLAESHLALAYVLQIALHFEAAKKAYDQALALGPGNARLLRDYGVFAVSMGWTDAGLAALRRALLLDPLNYHQHSFLGDALGSLRRYDESIAAYREALTLNPDDANSYANMGVNYFLLGNVQGARSWIEAKPTNRWAPLCLALIYDKLGRHHDAEVALANFEASFGDTYPFFFAQIYAQWGNSAKALEWLERAVRSRDPLLQNVKTDPLIDPLRKEPRFQAIERELKFPPN
jgi:TolB-like protein/Tfp pilus assembly protein PilF